MIASTTEPHWTPRPVLAFGVRVVQYGLPLLAGSVAVTVVAPLLVGLVPHLAVVGLSLAVAVVVSLFVSHLTMRLGPLAVLLKMTMIFPDHAPTRLKVARRSTSADEIRRRLTSGRTDEHEAAVTMLSLVTALGRHDKHTRGHSERVRLFCDLLSRELGLSEEDAGRLRWAALIHDIGKLEVAVTVLNKPGRLNVREWAQIRMHPQAGARLARPLAPWLGPWFAGIAEHHERFDGTGYPLGLAGDQISLAGRAVAVVDAYETMTAARTYKAAVSAVAARAELTRCAGTHFDPAMVRAFLGIALPRLLWSVGPLAFVVNLPVLRWVGDGGARLAQASSTAVNVAGVSAVVVASGALPAAAADPAPSAAKPGVHKVAKKASGHGTKKSTGKVAGSSAGGASGGRGPASTSTGQRAIPTSGPAPTRGATANPPPAGPPAAPTGPASPLDVPLPAGPGAPPAPPAPTATGTPPPAATASDDGHHRHKKKKPRRGKGKGSSKDGRESGRHG